MTFHLMALVMFSLIVTICEMLAVEMYIIVTLRPLKWYKVKCKYFMLLLAFRYWLTLALLPVVHFGMTIYEVSSEDVDGLLHISKMIGLKVLRGQCHPRVHRLSID